MEQTKEINGICFSERELDVIACLICGKTSKNIANILQISPNTVNTHIRNIALRIHKNSKSDIIKFIENSPEYKNLRQRYDKISGEDINCLQYNSIQSNNQNKIILIFFIIVIIITSLYLRKILLVNESNSIKYIPSYVSNSILLERKDICLQIDNNLKHSEINHIILTGEGGIGKTTLARSYLNRKKADVIFEINGENANTVWHSINMLAHLFITDKKTQIQIDLIEKITNKNARKKKIIEFIANKLKNSKNWYILFDNVNSFQDIKEYYPTDSNIWGNGTVLITTSNSHLCDTAFINNKKIIKIRELSNNEKFDLFRKITKSHIDTNMLNSVPPSPLDICIAAYYIKSTGISFSNYIKTICNKSTNNYIKEILNTTIDYPKTRYSIVVTSLSKILEKNKQSAPLLFLICLLNSNNIPIRVLNKLATTNVVNDFIFLIKKYALAEINDNSLTIHQVTQKIGLQYLCEILSKTEQDKILKDIVFTETEFNELMWYYYDDQKYQMSYKELNEIIPHLESLLNNLSMIETSSKKLYTQRIHLALLYAKSPELTRDEIKKFALEILQNNTGEISGYDLIALKLQYVYCLMDNPPKKAESLLMECITDAKKINAENLRALSEAYLATIYCSCNKIEQCKKLLSNSMSQKTSIKMRLLLNFRYCSIYSKIYANPAEINSIIQYTLNTIDIVNSNNKLTKIFDLEGESKNCIAALYRSLVSLYNIIGDTKKAEENYKKALNIYNRRKANGKSNPFSLISSLNIEYVNTLIIANQLKQAEKLLDSTIDLKLSKNNYQNLFKAYVYKSMLCIKLKKWEQVIQINQLAKNCRNINKFRETQIMELILTFNGIVACINMNNNNLLRQTVYEFIEQASKITHYKNHCVNTLFNDKNILKNIKEIFKGILGKNNFILNNYIKPICNKTEAPITN